MYKLFTTTVNNRISLYLESNSLLADEQNGFRPNRNCEDNILVLLILLKNLKTKILSTFVAFVAMLKGYQYLFMEMILL